MKINVTPAKKGIQQLGFIKNIRTFISELQSLLVATTQVARQVEIDASIDEQIASNSVRYLNKFGYPSDRDGKAYNAENAAYVCFTTPYKNNLGVEIIGWFFRQRVDQSFSGVSFGTQKEFRGHIKDATTFKMGDMIFDDWNDAISFLEDIAENTIPEKWTYNYHKSGIPHPILKSYLENVFEKLKKEEGKILKSDDNRYVVFNSNLLDRYFHDVFIVAEVIIEDGVLTYHNPFRYKGLRHLIELNFMVGGRTINNEEQLPETPTFFHDINEVVFQTSWAIDRSFENFKHIIEERKDRFPISYQAKKDDELARDLDNAIKYAIAIAQRNYKFIVPQYRPQIDKIQLLMPIYLSGSFTEKPDFALILDPDTVNQIYIPQTILPLDAAYQNARLITKPDEVWLNPENI